MSAPDSTLRLATRTSDLALAQTGLVCEALRQAKPDIQIDKRLMQTVADRHAEKPIAELGAKGVFVKELESALLSGEADIAVHSIKDMSVTLPEGLCLGAMLPRGPVEDVLVGCTLDALPKAAVVGTSSPRRAWQFQQLRPDCIIKPIRGNVPTRIRKQQQGDFDVILLAQAGLKRLEGSLGELVRYEVLSCAQMLPAIGQAAIGIECRADDTQTLALLQAINHEPTQRCVEAERRAGELLGVGCQTPLAVYACIQEDRMTVEARVPHLDNVEQSHTEKVQGEVTEGLVLAEKLVERLAQQGVSL